MKQRVEDFSSQASEPIWASLLRESQIRGDLAILVRFSVYCRVLAARRVTACLQSVGMTAPPLSLVSRSTYQSA